MDNEAINKIKLSKVKSMIPNLLYNKLEVIGKEDIKGVLELDISDFSKGKGIGKKAVKQFVAFHYLILHEPERLLEKYEENISNSIEIDEESDLGKVPLADISELIHNKLINKFQVNGVENIYELSEITEFDFSKWKSVGKTSKELFRELILKLKEEPEIFLTAYRNKTIPKSLPIKDSGQKLNNDYLEQFKRIVNDYLSLLIDKKERERDILIKRYGLFNNDQYNTVEIGLYYEVTNERIRQLILKHLNNFKILLKGETLDIPFCVVNSDSKKNIDLLIDFISGISVISFDNLVKSFKDNYNISSINQNQPYLNIILDVLEVVESSESSIPFSSNKYYFVDPKIDKSLFYETAKYCYDFLRDSVTPIKEFDLIISLRKQYRRVSKEYIQLVLSQISEIEKTTKGHYQIRFDCLKSGADQGERVLFEKERSMNLDEIVSEINHRLFNLGENKTITRKSLGSIIRHNKNIKPKGKTGYYSLVNWEENSETIYDVIYKSFLHHQKPLTYREIINYVKAIRPNLKDNSIRTVTNDRFLPIKGKKYIIPSWEHKYKELIISKRKKVKEVSIREQIRQMLLQEPEKKLNQKEFSGKAREKLKIGFSTFHASINDTNLFIKSVENGNRFVTAIENPIVKNINKRNETLNLIYTILESNNGTYSLSDIVKEIEKKGIKRPSIYKYITSDNNLLKSENEEGKKLITKRKKLNLIEKSDDDWNKIKKKIEREIKDIFDDSRQPQYPISFSDALDLFYKLIIKQTSESDLNGLEERLLPTLRKYFTSNDRNDRLNFLTQITTCIDPFLKKLLLFADNLKYQEFKRKPKNSQGLGKLIDYLDRLDSRLSRYKSEERNASLIPFGKQMFVAYSNRNVEAHAAENWAEKDIVKIITSCLVIYVFSIFEYYVELDRRL